MTYRCKVNGGKLILKHVEKNMLKHEKKGSEGLT
jgi:hypothetical protein